MNIITALNSYSSGCGGDEELNYIFNYCREIAVKNLYYLENKSNIKVYHHDNGEILEDKVCNYISSLWCPPDEKGLAPVAQIWLNIQKETGKDDIKAVFYLSNIIKDLVLKKRLEDLRQNRPQEWKLRRTIRSTIKRMEHFVVVRKQKRLYIMRSSNCNKKAVEVSLKTLERHCFRLFEGQDKIPELTYKATRILNLSVIRGNAIRFEQLANIITRFNINIMSNDSEKENVSCRLLDHIHMQNMLAPIYKRMRNLIWGTYVNKGKMSNDMAEIYLRALKLFINDFLNAGSGKHKEYFTQQLPAMNSATFEKQHKARFNYLVKELKSTLQEYASEMLQASGEQRKKA